MSKENLLKHFLSSNAEELEIRFDTTFEIWKNIYQKIITDYNTTSKIEESITATLANQIVPSTKQRQSRDRKDNEEKPPNPVRNRKESFFEKGVKKAEKYIKKEQIYRIVFNDVLNYRISLASETEVEAFSIANANEIRMKLRSSVFLEELSDWRLDFTFVKSLRDSSQFQNVVKYKDKLFPKSALNTESYLKHIENLISSGVFGTSDPQISFELELEYIGKAENLENLEKSLEQAIKFILGFVGEKQEETDYKDYHEKIFQISKLLMSLQDQSGNSISNLFKNKFVLKQLANQPIGFSYEEYCKKIIPKVNEYYLSDKANGDRCFVWITETKMLILTTTFYVDVTKFVISKGFKLDYFKDDTIFDAEVIDLNPEKAKFGKIYIFDLLYLNGQKLTQKKLEERNEQLDTLVSEFGKIIQKKILIRLDKDEFAGQIKKIYQGTRLYPVDGLIFTPNFTDPENIKYNTSENYFDMVVYKWKPPEQMTIDFMVMKVPQSLLGIKPYLPKEGYEMYFLFCGIKAQTFKILNMEYVPKYDEIFKGYKFQDVYFPIQFSPSVNPQAYIYYHPLDFKLEGLPISETELHGHVVEFKYDCHGALLNKDSLEKNKCFWIIEKLRPDRDINILKNIGYGNDFKTAEDTYISYQNPFTLEMLTNPHCVKEGKNEKDTNENKEKDNVQKYFLTNKETKYKALTKFNSFVKAQVIRQLQRSNWVIDLASGQGGDLFIYNSFQIGNLVVADKDKKALEELNRRKYELDNKEYYIYAPKPKNNCSIYSQNMDLTNNYEENIALLEDIPYPRKGVDGIVINMALHYIITNEGSLDNFVSLVDSLLKPGGIFIFTCFDGQKIFNLLKQIKYEESWDLMEDNEIKYSIKKLYREDEFTSLGYKISVIHPFSAGNYYEENLLNLDWVINAFKEKGYIVRQNSSFADWIFKFKQFNPKIHGALTRDDILYAGLYSYCSLWKPC